MEKENLNTGTPEQDEDVILPEGYDDENIFEEPSGDDENIFGKEDTIKGFGGEGEDKEDPAPESQPETQEPEKEDGVGAEGGSSAPADAQQEAAGRFKFKDGEQEVELQERDLPGIYRKAQEHAGLSGQLAQARQELETIAATAQRMGFQTAGQMMDKLYENYRNSEIKRLVDDGVNEEVARYMVENRVKQANPQQPAQQMQQPQAAPMRDFKQELNELVQLRPELRESLAKGGKLPQEVVTACVKDGIPLRAAYAEHEEKEARANAERVRRENDILKKNEENAAKAPVKSVTAGGGDTPKSKDPFLVGFDAD